jgi:hypothetical protein
VEEEPGPKGDHWKFLDPGGRQFLGASVYSVAGDPTFPCGLPRSDLDGAAAFLVRRTLGRLRVTSVIVPQDAGTVLAGGWYFENGSTGEIFLSVQGYPRHPRVPPRCASGPLVELNGACARRCRDTDDLDPYPGPSNVTLSLEVSAKGDEYALEFGYDEHSPTAGLARATLESVRIREPGAAACGRAPGRRGELASAQSLLPLPPVLQARAPCAS